MGFNVKIAGFILFFSIIQVTFAEELTLLPCCDDFVVEHLIDSRVYQPYLQIGGVRFLNTKDANAAASFDFFVPVWQISTEIIFVDARLYDRSGKPFEGNIHLGYRQLLSDEQQLFGVYGAFDRKKTTFDNYFSQVMLGWEYYYNRLFIGGNLYRPIGKKERYLGKRNIGTEVEIENRHDGIYKNVWLITGGLYEKALPGVDAEIGYELTRGLTAYLGGYFFKANGVKTICGPKILLSYDLAFNDERKIFGIFNKIGLEIGVQKDKPRGVVGYLSANFRIGLSPSHQKTLDGVARHMVDLVKRDFDLVTSTSSDTAKTLKERVLLAKLPVQSIDDPLKNKTKPYRSRWSIADYILPVTAFVSFYGAFREYFHPMYLEHNEALINGGRGDPELPCLANANGEMTIQRENSILLRLGVGAGLLLLDQFIGNFLPATLEEMPDELLPQTQSDHVNISDQSNLEQSQQQILQSPPQSLQRSLLGINTPQQHNIEMQSGRWWLRSSQHQPQIEEVVGEGQLGGMQQLQNEINEVQDQLERLKTQLGKLRSGVIDKKLEQEIARLEIYLQRLQKHKESLGLQLLPSLSNSYGIVELRLLTRLQLPYLEELEQKVMLNKLKKQHGEIVRLARSIAALRHATNNSLRNIANLPFLTEPSENNPEIEGLREYYLYVNRNNINMLFDANLKAIAHLRTLIEQQGVDMDILDMRVAGGQLVSKLSAAPYETPWFDVNMVREEDIERLSEAIDNLNVVYNMRIAEYIALERLIKDGVNSPKKESKLKLFLKNFLRY